MKQQGYTLIEVLVALGIVMFVIAAVLGIQAAVKGTYAFSLDTLVTVDYANGVVAEMSRVLRNARPADNGAFALEVLGDQQMAFYSNTDDDVQTERVRYFLDGTQLKRGVIEPSGFPAQYPTINEKITVLADTVHNGTSPLFYYYNSAYPADQVNNPLSVDKRLNQTTFIKMAVTVNAHPERPQSAYELQGFAQIRNLKQNL